MPGRGGAGQGRGDGSQGPRARRLEAPGSLRLVRPGLIPLGVTPLGLTPLGWTPLGLTPLGLTPLGLTPPGLTPPACCPRSPPWPCLQDGGKTAIFKYLFELSGSSLKLERYRCLVVLKGPPLSWPGSRRAPRGSKQACSGATLPGLLGCQPETWAASWALQCPSVCPGALDRPAWGVGAMAAREGALGGPGQEARGVVLP